MLQRLAEADGGSYSNEWLPAAMAAPPAPPVNGSLPADIAVVYTAEDFQRAFHEGVRDIELRAHIDTRQLGRIRSVLVTVGNARVTKRFGAVPSTTRSIRVRSSSIKTRNGTRMSPRPKHTAQHGIFLWAGVVSLAPHCRVTTGGSMPNILCSAVPTIPLQSMFGMLCLACVL